MLVVTSKTGRDIDIQRKTTAVLVVTSQTKETETHRQIDRCAGCDITDRQRHRHSEKETAVLVMTSQTGRDTDPQRNRQMCQL